MNQAVVTIGIGEMGAVFAKGFLRRLSRIVSESRAIQAFLLTLYGIKTDKFCQKCTAGET